jgi:hypothetical protein
LKEWVESHRHLADVEPFLSLDTLITAIISDGVIDEDEREVLLEICSGVRNNIGFMGDITQVIQCLHGIVSGLIFDKQVNKKEIVELEKWLKEYKEYENWWPLKEMRQHIKKILKDGIIDEKEEAFLLEYFTDFIEQRAEDQTLHDEGYKSVSYLKSESPVFKSISSICESCPDISFYNKQFCFTGPAASGQRTALFDIVISLGGIPQKSIVTTLDYLVIGAKSSPAWIYSTYGRKIEGVMKRKYNSPDCNTQIISEEDFLRAMTSASHK